MTRSEKTALAAAILLMPGGFVLGAALAAKHLHARYRARRGSGRKEEIA